MLSGKARERRERTFIGSECAVCEEPLEHILRGERILQLSCSHVAHEACFYEFVREFKEQSCPTCNAPLSVDPSRGGGIDFESLNKLVRSVNHLDEKENFRDPHSTPTPWDSDSTHENVRARQESHGTTHTKFSEPHRQANGRLEGFSDLHGRKGSVATQAYTDTRKGSTATQIYAETHNTTGRRHDYDVHSMESRLSHSRHTARNPIPSPSVTVRSEFPTLNKSRQQQSLTCLITVEVVDGKWQPNIEDLRNPPTVPLGPRDVDEARTSARAPSRTQRRPIEQHGPVDSVHEDEQALEEVKDELYKRVDNWHGLDFSRFGKLVLHGMVRVGKDRHTWQLLECYLFTEMLICVKEKRTAPTPNQSFDGSDVEPQKNRCTLKGSILIRKHLKQVELVPDTHTLSLSLSVTELPQFHLQFLERDQLDIWRRALVNIDRALPPEPHSEAEMSTSSTDDDEYATATTTRTNNRVSSAPSSSYGANRSPGTAPTEYTSSRFGGHGTRLNSAPAHVPLDVVVVIPVSSSMQVLKVNLLRDSLRFLVASLGEGDRMGLVTFGSGGGGVPLVGMTTKSWSGWSKVLDSIKPVGQKSMRADVVEGANVAMDLLMQRKSTNPLSHILLISDSAASDQESVDFVVSRAEAAKIAIHSFGLGLTHKPDTMVDLSTRTKASYTYVKDWMMLRECLAGCLGSLQSTSHSNVKLKLRLPEGSPAKFVKISGALQITKRATGRDAEASLGDLRFGDKRDILVQLAIPPDNSSPDSIPTDPWENVIAGLEALGGGADSDDARALSVEELPLIQADLSWGDILREGNLTQLPRPSLLTITVLPAPPKRAVQRRTQTPPIPPHPSIVQRRMELLTSDMLTRALTLVSRGQHDRANHLLSETRSILKGLGKGGLPPLPPPSGALPPTPSLPSISKSDESQPSPADVHRGPVPDSRRTPSPPGSDTLNPFTPASGIDPATMLALDSELASSLEWISHPAVFSRDSRKAIFQAIGVIGSQRGYTFRTPAESLWAARVPGVRSLSERNREWREVVDDALMEEA